MNYKIVNITNSGSRSILIIYTGGTFGMVLDEEGSLVPFNFGRIVDRVPELKSLDIKLTTISFPEPIDSSNVKVQDWKDIAYIIEENYAQYDGFVILHGTDTMAYTSSVLSFMLKGLNKPVILTGAQMPIGFVRSDARENLITALEIASYQENDHPVVSEVCIYFNYILLRGNRAQKIRSSRFAAFESENYSYLAEAGIEIEYNYAALKQYEPSGTLEVQYELDPNVGILKLFPGIKKSIIDSYLRDPDLKAVIIESFGSGNMMTDDWFLDSLKKASRRNIILLNVSQCIGGDVKQGRYESSKELNEIGVVSGGDLTTEAAAAKLMHLLGTGLETEVIKEKLQIPMVGEMDL